MAQLEEAFYEEIELERSRRTRLRRTAATRSRQRAFERAERRGSLRFALLALSLVATAVIVTVAMFASLSALLG